METILLAGLTLQAWLVIVTVIAVLGLMLFTNLPADFVFLGSVAFLLLSGALPEAEVLSCFSSSTVVLIGALFVVVSGLVHTGFLQWIIKYCLGSPRSFGGAIARLMIPVAALSSFLNNTTVVALFTKVVKMWSKKLGISPSRLLIPLSYASGMGGVCTLIGTPPNLIISGFYTNETGIPLNIFTPTLVGLLCLAVGVLSLIAMKRLLPDRRSPEDILESNTASYTVELMVPSMSDLVGKTLRESGLDSVDGGHIVEIIRLDREIISPVAPDEFIFGGDRLIFAGEVDKILKLREKYQLVNATHHVFSFDEVDAAHRKLQMANVRFDSSLLGKRMADTDFEERNNLVLVAIARQGEVVGGSPREAVLEAGDTLLLECSSKFNLGKECSRELTGLETDLLPVSSKKTMLASFILLAMVLLSSLGVMTLLQASFLAAAAMIVCRCTSLTQARDSIDWRLLMIFAGSVCLGDAIQSTGIAEMISENILDLCGSNPYLTISIICLVAVFVTEFTSNTATAAIFVPITFQAAQTLGVNPLSFCIALMMAVSSGYASPIGSPTHMLIYGPGGYRFSDFFRVGLPMDFIMLAASLLFSFLLFPL